MSYMNMALAESSPSYQPRRIVVGELQIVPEACHVAWRGREVNLTTRHVEMLQTLVGRKGFFVPYAELYRIFKPTGFHVGEGPDGVRACIRTHAKRMRKAFLSVDPEFEQIENQNGFGYRWKS